MRLLILTVSLLAAVGCGGGGASPELYAIVVDYFAAPASCYQTPPTTTTSPGPLGTIQGEVWDGAEAKAFLVLSGAGINVDMGDAPTVVVGAGTALEGQLNAPAWTFATDRTTTTTLPISGATAVVKTHAALTFPRAASGTGTLSLSSSQTCTGAGCPTTMPSCLIDGVRVRTTRLAVDYLKTP